MIKVHVVATGVANTASVRSAFARLGCNTALVETPAEVRDAELLVLPGVGAFAAAMTRLREQDWQSPLQQRIRDGRPTLAICLGLQLLGASSDESADETGLDVIPAVARRFADDERVPHMGWNRVEADESCRILGSGAAYFAHSYRWPTDADLPGFATATTCYGQPFVAAIERGAVVACQFHPELSGEFGATILYRWLKEGERC